MTLTILPMTTKQAQHYWAGQPDANGQPPERNNSYGGPCRHCLQAIPEGRGTLVLNYTPFSTRQPYAESGPIFYVAVSASLIAIASRSQQSIASIPRP
ncbi:DUF1203 domain-containing protein [Porticoccaceae bacterium]|nr:DUF1203 domain-containing protein [Porticoccaceae bacterium]